MLGWPLFATPEPGSLHAAPDLLAVVRDLAEVGVILLMFVAGLETDLAELRRVGKVAFRLQRLEALDSRKSRIMEMGLFGGLSLEETAEALNVSVATVRRDWSLVRAWLSRDRKSVR